jgi:hypothetical protein
MGVHAILSNVGSTRGRKRLVPRTAFGATVGAVVATFDGGVLVSASVCGSAEGCIASPRRATWRWARSNS